MSDDKKPSLLGELFSVSSKEEAERLLTEAAEKFNIPLPALRELATRELGAEDWNNLPPELGSKRHRDEAIRALADVGGSQRDRAHAIEARRKGEEMERASRRKAPDDDDSGPSGAPATPLPPT